jgi:penicillin-binding protein 2
MVIGGLLAILALRLWQIQIVQGEYFLRLSEANGLRITSITAPRGLIVDKTGRLIVANRPAFTVSVLQTELRSPQHEIPIVARLLGMTAAEVTQKLADAQDRPFAPVRLRRDVSKDIVAAIEESRMDLPGVLVEVEPVRQYIYHDLAGHMLGYVGEVNTRELRTLKLQGYEQGELIGRDGVERMYNQYLRGRNGEIQAEVDALGRPVRTIKTVAAIPGNTVVLGINLDVQQAAEAALGDRLGAVIAMDPRTGLVVAFASHPAFDANLFSAGITAAAWNGLLHDSRQPLINRVSQSVYPTGSVFKIVTASAALELRLVSPTTRFFCPGFYTLGGRVFHDHEEHGNINFLDAIAQSCNVVFWTVSRPVGPDHLAEYARMYGLGEATGIDLPQESPGVIPDPEWKKRTYGEAWFEGDTLNTAVGQGYVLATPLQVARMIAAVANGGELVTPHVVSEVRTPAGRVITRIAPPPGGRLRLSAQTMAVLQAGLAAVVTRGTASSIQIPGLAVAGKTGTAESTHGKPYAWFAGYAPAQAPQLVVVAMVENAGYGAEFAAPIVQKVLQVAFGLVPGANGAPGTPRPAGSPPAPGKDPGAHEGRP